jgi:predicted outer membrane repeat protein
VYTDCVDDEAVSGGQFSGSGSGQFCMEFDDALSALENGMTLILQPGIHVLKTPVLLDTRGLWDISIIGSGISETEITCESGLGLAFVRVDNLYFANFTISNCGLTGENLEFPLTLLLQSLDMWVLVPLTTRVALFVGDCKDMSVFNVHITNTTGLGLLGINIIGESRLSGVNFTRNIRPRCLDAEPILPSFIVPEIYDQVGGGAFFLYSDYHNTSEVTDEVYLYLKGCYFAHNADCMYASTINVNFPLFTTSTRKPSAPTNSRQGLYNYTVGAGGGLSVVLANTYFGVSAIVSDTVFFQNDARYGGGAYVATFAGFLFPVSVLFLDCTFEENGLAVPDSVLDETYSQGGAGLAVFTDLVKPEHFMNSIPSPEGMVVSLILDGTDFIRNQAGKQGAGVVAYSLFSTPLANQDQQALNHYLIVWYFSNTSFLSNDAKGSSAAFFTQLITSGIGGSVLVILEDMYVSRNELSQGFFQSVNEYASALHLKDVSTLFLGEGNVVSENQGSGIRVESTIITVFFNTSITFQRNLAHRGGALHFTGTNSGIIVYPNSSLNFINNQAALEGGAIYYDELSNSVGTLLPANYHGCYLTTPFFDIPRFVDPFFGLFSENISISFTNNSAPLGGTVFGSSLESCPWANNISSNGSFSLYQTLQGFNSTFSFSEDPTGLDRVSTLPAKLVVTLLDDTENDIAGVVAFPGQAIKVRIEVFDIYGHTLPAVVTSVVDQSVFSAHSRLGDSGFWHTSISDTELSVTGTAKGLIDVSIITDSNSLSSSFSVYLKPCPLGFFISPTNQKCTCDALLRKAADIDCSEDTISFSTIENIWIGTDLNIINPNSGDLIVGFCLLNFCNRTFSNRSVDPSRFDAQCASNRAGVLCGACAEGFSTVLGSNECKRCSNYWLFILLLFGLSGAVVFTAVALLEITIDKGWTVSVFFFSFTVAFLDFLSPSQTFLYYALPTHLLSLRLSVSTCLFNGMTALHRCYFTFAFPAYLLILMTIFALLCRRYTWMSIHFSPAKTLVTLILLCYFNVLTTTLDIIVPIRVETLGGDVSLRWRVDPNQRYFGDAAHGFLVLIGFVLLFVYIIPVPILFLLPPLAYRCLKRFSPFLDVMWAAFKPKLRFWLGVRVILLIALYLTARSVPNVRLFSNIILVGFTHIQTLLQPFKDKWANYADAVLSVMVVIQYWNGQTISESDYDGSVRVGADLSYAMLFIVRYGIFLSLFCLHLYRQFFSAKIELWKTAKAKRRSTINLKHSKVSITTLDMADLATDVVQDSERPSSPSQFPNMCVTPQYRESIFSDHV